MLEEASINFYEITKCGYYKPGNQVQEFCSQKDMLEELLLWVKDKDLGDTCTYAIEESENGYHTYCLDIAKSISSEEFIITTWNETPSTQGNIASVSPTSKVGKANVALTPLPKNNIPGYATYFWFIPNKNILATIRFHHAVNGHQNLCRYLKTFLAKWTSFVATNENDVEADHSIIGYRKDINTEPLNLNPMFESYLKKKPGKIEFIVNNRENIRTIYRKNLLSPKSQVDITFLNQMLEKLGVQDPPQTDHEVKVKYEFNYTPEEAELNSIITEWEHNHSTKWDDIGFKLQKDDGTYWLSYSLAKRSIKLDITRENAEIVTASSLLNAILDNRQVLLQELT